MTVNHVGNGYNYEVAEVMRCLRVCCLESPVSRPSTIPMPR
jgi:hypothetical protein